MTASDLEAGYAADGYARTKGLGAVSVAVRGGNAEHDQRHCALRSHRLFFLERKFSGTDSLIRSRI